MDIEHCLMCTTQWFDRCIYCKMMTTIMLVNISIVLIFVVITFKIYCHKNFHMYSTVLLNLVTLLYLYLNYIDDSKFFPKVTVSIYIAAAAAAAAKSLQSCPTLCDPIDGSPPGSSIPGILQARTLEWVSISFSNAWKWKVKVKLLSHVRLLATPWTVAYQAAPSMGFSRQEYWSGVPLPSSNLYCY